MSNEIVQHFSNSQFGELRTIKGDGGKILFAAKDVALALGYSNPHDAVHKHCKGIAIRYPLETSGGVQQFRFIAEPDLYRLIVNSKLESARQFEAWVFEEVLPAIRESGGYMVARYETPEQTMARAMLIAQQTIERQNARIAELEPKALFADAVAASDGTCLIGELAKMLRQNGVEVGQNRLFGIFREQGFLGKTGSNRNVPTQRAIEMGLFRIKETVVTHSDGHTSISRTPKVTGKGQAYFMRRFGGMTDG